MRQTPHRRLHAVTAAVLGLGLLLSSCSRGDTASEGPTGSQGVGSADTTPDIVQSASGEPTPGGTLTFGLEAETDGWNPTSNRWATSGVQVALAVFDPLVAFDKDFNPKPY